MTDGRTSPTDAEASVRRLLDESEIRAVLARLARGMDRFDFDSVASCYHHDATEAHGHYNGDVKGFIEHARGWADTIESLTHFYGQSLIEVNGDSAWVESYCLCLVRTLSEADKQATDLLANVRYVDVFERRSGSWRILRRKVVHSPSQLNPVDIVVALGDKAFRAQPGPDDPSYDRRPESFLP